jgi:hypothetical protein
MSKRIDTISDRLATILEYIQKGEDSVVLATRLKSKTGGEAPYYQDSSVPICTAPSPVHHTPVISTKTAPQAEEPVGAGGSKKLDVEAVAGDIYRFLRCDPQFGVDGPNIEITIDCDSNDDTDIRQQCDDNLTEDESEEGNDADAPYNSLLRSLGTPKKT